MPRDANDYLGRRIAELEGQVKKLQKGRLNNSALMGGSIPIFDYDERLRAVIGRQDDESWGSRVVSSPDQPVPTGLSVTVGRAGAVEVSWPGSADAGVPLVHGRVEVWSQHVAEGESPDVSQARLRSTIRDRDGGSTTISCPVSGTWAVWLRMVGQDNVTAGEFGEPVTFEVESLFDADDFEERFEERLLEFADGNLEDAAYNSLMARLGEFLVVRAGQVEADAIDGMTITGTTVQSNPEPDLGTKMDPSGFWGFSPAGDVVFRVGTDGVVYVVGEIEAKSASGSSTVLSSGDVLYRVGTRSGDSWALNYSDRVSTGPFLKFRRDGIESQYSPTIVWDDETGELIIAPQQFGSSLDSGVRVPSTLSAERMLVEGNARVAGNLQAFGTIGTYQSINFPNSFSANRPCFYRQLGQLVFLSGSVNSNVNNNFGGSICQLPPPPSNAQLISHRTNSAGSLSPMPITIGTDGWMSVPGGSGISSGTPMSLDGLVYIAG